MVEQASAGARATQGQKLAYSHRLSIETAPQSVKPRFERARDACLSPTSNDCELLYASIDGGDTSLGARPHASLTVRLPHAAVTGFEEALLAPLAGEQPGETILRSRSTAADDLTTAIADVDRRLAQLNDYRDRLTILAQRADAKVEDLVKVESELSSVQSQIEALTGQQRKLTRRVDTETLTVDLDAAVPLDGIGAPIATAWRDASTVLGQNAASALRFGIGSVPWLPLLAFAFAVLRFARPFLVWRRHS
ncbi:MAG TPA: DUF4349 domain-containing protein [Stellaceae bacterium]|nr:DUF4349 domain-containing protein [Stellaceae bacterium]